jgi:phosphotransferase system IIB component
MSHLDEFKRLNHESINSLIVASGIVKLSSKSVQLIFNTLKESDKNNNLFAKFAQPEILENKECY